ncbi:OLC1v1004680C1 [Oldenlandia corymbosa var. corymbosa]|uniref:OLC1v1004680C1 n=1 Tax=Oldenlandia corymbosa var. corymbosa TaxID=529605 RepID=A0AAV1DEX4_OLDCO|nr:OLC1v1004680C1 [Oldenlandia corymbosa var. corymbosa]
MSVGVVSSVLNQLSTFIVEEAKLLRELGLEIQGIVNELEHMKAFLMFAEGIEEEEDPRLQVWISQVQDAAYDIEDIVDEFRLRCNHQDGVKFCGLAQKIFGSMKSLRARHQIAHEIEGMKSRIKSICEGHKRYQTYYGTPNQAPSTYPSAVNNLWRDCRDDALLVEEANLVGIDSPKQQLISELLDHDPRLKVVSIFGMGGLGKTTLVKKIQQDVGSEFEVIVWISVSQTYDMLEVLKELIHQLFQEIRKPVPREVASLMSTDQLKLFVKGFLKDKRFLIVFDDVWDIKFWDGIKWALPDKVNRNRVMLTTRIEDIAYASSVEFSTYVHKMQSLSQEDSWILFCKRTFKDSCCPIHLKKVALRIMKKCEGLPLAIVTIGGVLALKDRSRIDEWKMVQHSLGGEVVIKGKLDNIKSILSLSYNELPDHLKTCLLYASIFPEDYKIRESRLIRFWISEGFVMEKTGMSTYDVARAYLHELINRSLIQIVRGSYDASGRMYHIHDILREIILSKASRRNFAIMATGKQRWPKKIRRLAIHDFKFAAESRGHFKYLRSMVIFKSVEPLPTSILSKLLRGSSRLLKVLDLGGTQLEEIPEEVFKLYHLKTLNLKGTRVKDIPKAIGHLKNLEFLDLSYTNVRELPNEILKIEGLIHLIVFDKPSDSTFVLNGFKGPKGIVKLSCLEWLCHIEANEILIREIGELKHLKVLGIKSLRQQDGKQLCSSLGKLSNLEDLCLRAIKDDEMLDLDDMNLVVHSGLLNLQVLSLWSQLRNVPKIISSLQELTSIELGWSRLMVDPLEYLQCLPNLRSLFLYKAFDGKSLCFKAGCFLKLENLILWRLYNLRELRINKDAMPNLRELSIISLESLKELPWGVKYLTKLQLLYIGGIMDEVIVKQVRGPCEEISHIPKIRIHTEVAESKEAPVRKKPLLSYHTSIRHLRYFVTNEESREPTDD